MILQIRYFDIIKSMFWHKKSSWFGDITIPFMWYKKSYLWYHKVKVIFNIKTSILWYHKICRILNWGVMTPVFYLCYFFSIFLPIQNLELSLFQRTERQKQFLISHNRFIYITKSKWFLMSQNQFLLIQNQFFDSTYSILWYKKITMILWFNKSIVWYHKIEYVISQNWFCDSQNHKLFVDVTK